MTFETGKIKRLAEYPSAERVVLVAYDPNRPSDMPDLCSHDSEPDDKAPRVTFYRRRGKRIFDVTLVLFCAPIWVPLIVLLALIVALDGGSPFYIQERVGKGGRSFRMWKLRSMLTGAEAMLEGYLATDPEARAEWEEKQKLTKDPRITRFGRFIRKTSLDELPQLWNVLKGEMSLVGPRPMMVEQQVLYDGSAYYSLRPGVTGEWQVCARNRSSFLSRAAFDESYNRDLSLAHDLYLILKTVPSVILERGL